GRAVLAGAALALIIGGVAGAIWMLQPIAQKGDLIDLAVYRAAGRALLHGHSIYGPYVAHHQSAHLPFTYPPIAAVFAAPLSLLGATAVNILWTVASVGLLVAVVRLCFAPVLSRFRSGLPIALALAVGAMLATSPVEENLRFGQV